MNKVKVTYTETNPSFSKRIKAMVDKKKIINEYIRNGKDLSKLNEKGIKLKFPL